MSQVIQITDWALHKFLEKVEEAVIAGYRTHKTPTSFAKSIGGRYVVTMAKAVEGDSPKEEVPVDDVVVKPTTRKTPTKKTGDESGS